VATAYTEMAMQLLGVPDVLPAVGPVEAPPGS
jgi:hypothetical protein